MGFGVKHTETSKNMQNGIYLFGIAYSDLLPDLEGTGLEEQMPLILHRVKDIVAVAGTVCLEDFCSEEAQAKLQDLNWVAPRACRHELVLEQIMAHSPLFPARFGTIFSAREKLYRLLEERYPAILSFLEKMRDKEEWSLKGFLDKTAAKEKLFALLVSQNREKLAALAPGKRYFEEQRIKNSLDAELNHWLKERAKKLAADLSGYAADFCERKVLSREVTGKDTDMALNWAFLVPKDRVMDFCECIKKLNTEYNQWGIALEYSGPWPPYSFSASLMPV
ncbi:MAG: GvpL/GvpF family gas vesicle protein [Candidatus Schekmanbacteria bacterium]|nr:GvpL/GvpF family gas vesicle protein [Candidatus Schekmanbacteria bacterium]